MYKEPRSGPYAQGAEKTEKCESSPDDGEENQQGMETLSTSSRLPPSREPQYGGSYVVVPPDETKRNKLQQIAAKELEDLERWKVEHRLGPINMNPVQLGGSMSEAEARQNQLIEHRQAKYKQKLRREECRRKQRDEEEAKIQKQKSVQREKANKLEEKIKQEQFQRQEQHKNEHSRQNETFLTRLMHEMPASSRYEESPYYFKPNTWDKIHTYRDLQKEEENKKLQKMKEEQRRKSELLEEKQKVKEEQRLQEIQNEHRRVNSTFLDKLERKTGSTMSRHQVSCERSSEGIDSNSTLICGNTLPSDTESTDTSCGDDCDQEWIIMKLHSVFPYYERSALGEVLQQCNWDYNHACELLS